MAKNPLNGVNPNFIAIVGGVVLIAAAGVIGAFTGTINISSAAIATIGAVITGGGILNSMKK